MIEWRRARDAGALAGLAEKPGRPARTPAEVEADRLRRENERLRAELAKSKAALEVAGKAHALLELLSESADTDGKSAR
jgi:transposase-like protein